MIVAIHQPNFFPWLGYFDKIARADKFIFMDNAQFPRTGAGTWVNRVRMRIGTGYDWATMPVEKSRGDVLPIKDVRLHQVEFPKWRGKFLKTVRNSYGRHPFFKEVFPLVESTFGHQTELLSDFNMNAIREIMVSLGMNQEKLVLGSGLGAEGNATALLINMTKAAGGDAYLCGGGAGGYQEDHLFAEAGLGLTYQNFKHPEYGQFGNEDGFVSGLSILDALFNCGAAKTRNLLGVC